MLERFEMSDGLGRNLSSDAECDYRAAVPRHSMDDRRLIRAIDEFEKLGIDAPNGI